MGNIWITSDWHFCHNRDFVYEPRGFNNIYEMNLALVKLYNECVEPDDDVYMLGDLMLNNDEYGLDLIKELKGRIHVALGNHDTNNRVKLYKTCDNIVDIQLAYKFKYDGYHFFLTHYPCICSNFDYDKPLRERLISLCGHSHTKDPFSNWDQGVIYHCEVDAHYCSPILLDDVIQDIKSKYYGN